MSRARSLVAVLALVLPLAACGGGEATPEEAYLRDTREGIEALLGEDVPEYADEELLTFGERTCENLAEVTDADTLRRTLEAASVGSSDDETLQVAQATVLVVNAARHLCPEQGRRLGLLEEGSQA